jgi:hypothetical protein
MATEPVTALSLFDGGLALIVSRVSRHIRFESNIASLEANIFKQNSELKG